MRHFFLNIRNFSILIAAVAGLLLATGCGDSGEINVETGSLTKAQFIKRADAICREAVIKVELATQAFVQSAKSADSPQAAFKTGAGKLISTSFVPAFEEEIDRVSSLGAPSGDEEEIAAILEAQQQGLDEAREDPVEFLRRASPFTKAFRLGQSYGFATCGQP